MQTETAKGESGRPAVELRSLEGFWKNLLRDCGAFPLKDHRFNIPMSAHLNFHYRMGALALRNFLKSRTWDFRDFSTVYGWGAPKFAVGDENLWPRCAMGICHWDRMFDIWGKMCASRILVDWGKILVFRAGPVAAPMEQIEKKTALSQ